MAMISAPVTSAGVKIGSAPMFPWCCFERWKRTGSARRPVPEPPHIAVEVVSPSESAYFPDEKIAAYLANGVAEVWVLYHQTEHMLIYTSDNVRMLHGNAILETPLLPGWSLAMSDLLRQQDGVYF